MNFTDDDQDKKWHTLTRIMGTKQEVFGVWVISPGISSIKHLIPF